MNPLYAPSWPPTSKSKKSPRVREGPYPSQIKTSADVPGAKGQIHIMLPNISTATVHRWGTGHKRCPAHARRANVPPVDVVKSLRCACAASCTPPQNNSKCVQRSDPGHLPKSLPWPARPPLSPAFRLQACAQIHNKLQCGTREKVPILYTSSLALNMYGRSGSEGTSGGTSIAGIHGDGGGDSRLGISKEMESMIDSPHTTLIILQLHMPIVQKGQPPSRVPEAQ